MPAMIVRGVKTGNEFPNERTTTVELKDTGKTKVEIPDEARKKISG